MPSRSEDISSCIMGLRDGADGFWSLADIARAEQDFKLDMLDSLCIGVYGGTSRRDDHVE